MSRAPGIRLGIDLGGTKIEIAALDGQGAFVLRERVATPQGDYAGTLRAMASKAAKSFFFAGSSSARSPYTSSVLT